MTNYCDTGVLLKLYTAEPDSGSVEVFVRRQGRPLHLTELHQSELTSAFRLKQFRRECNVSQADHGLITIKQDIRRGVLRLVAVDWEAVWHRCMTLAGKHAAATGCRTLDTLHVACALHLGAEAFITTDSRQAALAAKLRLKVINPVTEF